jgi:mannose/cellobiose epimerase-like protein (N-acyl-D-glucosamine 2-epimerase family)
VTHRSITPTKKPSVAAGRLRDFVITSALPLWASSGFDEKACCFHERLDLSNRPIRNSPRRLMVQSRQIAVYARAALNGWYPDGRPRALRAFEMVSRQYPAPDGGAGWIFSLHPDGSIADGTRDLYCHAFVLYMMAWVYRLTGDPAVLTLADTTLSDLDRIFSISDQPGFVSKVPGRIDLREQNPHMHLLEALLTLAEMTGAERYLARAKALIELFDRALSDAATGIVREIFDASWRPTQPSGANNFEPGHQMEWAWLLREWQRLTGDPVDERVHRLTTCAINFGIDTHKGVVRSVVCEDGTIISSASRTWSQTEAIRTLCREDPQGQAWPDLACAITDNLFATHLPARLNGGWIDQLSDQGVATIDFMPASTLYHVAGAAIDSEAVSQMRCG